MNAQSDNQFLKEIQIGFLQEITDILTLCEDSFMKLEKNPDDPAVMGQILRLFHNIKGSAAAVGFLDLSGFSHKVENLLVKVKNNELKLDGPVIDLLLKCNDRVIHSINELKESLSAVIDYEDLTTQLLEIAEGKKPIQDKENTMTKKKNEPVEEIKAPTSLQAAKEQTQEFLLLASSENPESLLRLVKSIRQMIALKPDLPSSKLDMLNSFSDMIETCLESKIALDLKQISAEISPIIEEILEKKVEQKKQKEETCIDNSLMRDFFIDAVEQLDAVERALVEMKKGSEQQERIDLLFRGFHTLKSSSAIVGISVIEEISHKTESLLEKSRSAKIALTPKHLSVITDCTTLIRTMVDKIKEGIIPSRTTDVEQILEQLSLAECTPNQTEQVETTAMSAPIQGENKQVNNQMMIREPIKVDAERLDRLIDTIGELVIAEAMVSQSSDLKIFQPGTPVFKHMDRLSKITRNLQEIGMSLRMVPIKQTFQKMARIVRDVSKKLDKEVSFEIYGEDTELDKTVADKIGDPLVHMVRNAVDHGIEKTAKERTNKGKPPSGRIILKSFHKGGSIWIEITDDGKGLDPKFLINKAIEKKLLKPDVVLTDKEAFDLIFMAGFSTAEKLTDVSGRGVGMDVVRRNIEELHGQVEIESTKGEGTTFRIRIPNTLAIIEGMITQTGNERYVIPTLSIIRAITPSKKQIIHSAKTNQDMLDLNGEIIPLFRLHEIYKIQDAITDSNKAITLILEDNQKKIALQVDNIIKQQQFVIKNLGDMMKNVPGVSGGTIMSDGQVGLILDISLFIQYLDTYSNSRLLKDEQHHAEEVSP